MRNSDEINQFAWAGYRVRNPAWGLSRRSPSTSISGSITSTAAERPLSGAQPQRQRDLPQQLERQLERHAPERAISTYELRGGPSIRLPGDWAGNLSLNSDSGRAVSSAWGEVEASRTMAAAGRATSGVPRAGRPDNAVSLQANPSYSRRRPDLQYVETGEVSGATRYLYATLDQRTFSLTFRIDVALSPALTLQYYGAPFLSSGGSVTSSGSPTAGGAVRRPLRESRLGTSTTTRTRTRTRST